MIGDLVLGYIVLAGQLLDRHRPIMYPLATSAPGVVVPPRELPTLLTAGLQMDLRAVAARFSDHAVKRVNSIVRTVETARQLLSALTKDARERNDPLPDDEFGNLLNGLSQTAERKLSSWNKRAVGLRTGITTLVNLMVRYIGLDKDLCEVESSARRFEIVLDRWEQNRMDELRGK
ncbi:hypothetical protein [Streptacidiphilus sp. PAMC 29251]